VATNDQFFAQAKHGIIPSFMEGTQGQVGQVRVLVHQQSGDQRFVMAISAQVFL